MQYFINKKFVCVRTRTAIQRRTNTTAIMIRFPDGDIMCFYYTLVRTGGLWKWDDSPPSTELSAVSREKAVSLFVKLMRLT